MAINDQVRTDRGTVRDVSEGRDESLTDIEATSLQGVSVGSASPTEDQALAHDGTSWTPRDVVASMLKGEGVFNACHAAYGADPSNSGAANTSAIQSVITACGNAGGGAVWVTKPGTYDLDEVGANPYQSGHRHCLDIDADDITLMLGAGVTLQLADDQQTDANGPVDVIVGRDMSGVSIVGAGPGASRITGNTAGQTGWTGGYSQVDQGTPWRFYATAAGGLSNVKVEGLQVDDFFGTSGVVGTVIGGADSDIPNSEVVYRDIFSFDCGEGPLVTRTDGVTWENVSVEERSSVSAGDGAEVALSNNVTITNLRVKVNGGASVATAFDLFGCKRVTVTNFIFDGWNSGFSLGTTSNGTNCDDVVISNGVAHGLTTASGVVSAASDVGFFQVTNVEIADTSNLGLQLNMDPTAGPALFMNCRWINATAARCLQGTNAIFIGCEFSEQVNGIDIVHSTADTPDVRLVNCVFRNNTDAIEVNGNGNAFSPTGAIINPTLSGNTNVLNARQSGTFDSMDMKGLNLPEADRPAAGIAGRQIFNTDDGALNIDTGSAWVEKGAVLTAADGSTVDGTYGTQERDVIQNLVTRVGELESRLQDANILA